MVDTAARRRDRGFAVFQPGGCAGDEPALRPHPNADAGPAFLYRRGGSTGAGGQVHPGGRGLSGRDQCRSDQYPELSQDRPFADLYQSADPGAGERPKRDPAG